MHKTVKYGRANSTKLKTSNEKHLSFVDDVPEQLPRTKAKSISMITIDELLNRIQIPIDNL